MLRFTHRKQQK